MKKINLGSGTDYKEGYINLDIQSKLNPDIVCDIDKGLPFEDNSIDEVYSSHLLEHVKDIFFVIDEIKRVLKKDGMFISRVPHFSCLSAPYYQHVRNFRAGDPRDFGFKIDKLKLRWRWLELNENRFTTFFERNMLLNSIFPASEIYFELRK